MKTPTVALIWRMLSEGMSPKAVADSTGENLDDVLELKWEMP